MVNVLIKPAIPEKLMKLPNLKGKKLLVMGGTSGMGWEVACLAKKQGARVWVVGTTTPKDGIDYLSRDLTRPGAIRRVYNRVGEVDLVLNTVGYFGQGRVKDMPYCEWKRTIDVNLNTMFLLNQYALDYLKKDGIIVNIATKPHWDTLVNFSAYAISKCGVIALTKAVAEENPQVKAYAICPSRVDTKFRDELFPDEDRLTRLNPKDVARVIMYLFSGNLPSGNNYWMKKLYE